MQKTIKSQSNFQIIVKILLFISVIGISGIILFTTYVCASFGPCFIFGQETNVPGKTVTYQINNAASTTIKRVSITSKLGSSDYQISVPPSEVISIHTYTNGEDSPNIKLEFETGEILTTGTYVEPGYNMMTKVISPQKAVWCQRKWLQKEWDNCY